MKLNVSFVASNTVVILAEALIFFKEPANLIRLSGIVLSLVGLFLLRYAPGK